MRLSSSVRILWTAIPLSVLTLRQKSCNSACQDRKDANEIFVDNYVLNPDTFYADISLVVEGQLYVPGSRRLPYGGQDVTERLLALLGTGQDGRALRLGELERLKHKCMRFPVPTAPLPGVGSDYAVFSGACPEGSCSC